MAQLLRNNIALKSDQTEGNAFRLESGWHLIAGGVTTGNSLPAEGVTLQIQFKNESGVLTGWQNSNVVLNAANTWQDLFAASSQVEYRCVTTGDAGATVHVSLAPLAVFN